MTTTRTTLRTTMPSSGTSVFHESAKAQVAGAAHYVDDLPVLQGTLYAAPVTSTIAHGRLLQIDATAALALPGVLRVIDSRAIRGDKVIASFSHDEPILAIDRVQHVGQVVALVVATSMNLARRAARLVKLHIEPLHAILSIGQAVAAKSWVLPPVEVKRGDALAAINWAKHQLTGSFVVGGQEHFYLEGQVAYAVPQEQNQMLVYSSSQHPGEVQHWISHALAVSNADVRVECRRMGGGFGGKETQAGHVALWAAIAADVVKCPVKVRLDRDDDFHITGKRHNFEYEYTVGFDDDGHIAGLDVTMASQCGFSADLSGPVNDRAVFHLDNCYFLEHVKITSLRCKTNTQSNTAFRGFGGPQGMIVMEVIIGDVARHLGLDALDVRKRNFYGTIDRNVTPYQMTVTDNIIEPLVAELAKTSRYRERKAAIAQWNSSNELIKKGIAITPVKFGISFTATHFNQAGALVQVYTDGSVLINHGGTEMGQGLHTKVCQIVADELGVPFDRVRISASDTAKVANASATAASSGTDLNGRAAQMAAKEIKQRLVDFSLKQGKNYQDESFEFWVQKAYMARIQLWSDGFYATPKIHYDKTTLTGRPFFYFAYGAACVEVVIDTLTGENRVLAVDILHDAGRSINPGIDIGQIEGGFVQGMGWLTTEELVWNADGKLTTHAPSTYKIPTAFDVPEHFNVSLWPEPNREDNIFGSKAVGEPPFMLAIAVFEALRDAVSAVKCGAVKLDAPATPERVLMSIVTQSPKSS
jgi:xanthine dehydrogenase large subunit